MKQKDLNILKKHLNVKVEKKCQVCSYVDDGDREENGIDTFHIGKGVCKILTEFMKGKEMPGTIDNVFVNDLNAFYNENSYSVGICWDCSICADEEVRGVINQLKNKK
jgi:hypothetical protein